MTRATSTARTAAKPLPRPIRRVLGRLDRRLRGTAALRGVGAEIVSYVPNNAYLVRVSAAGARQPACASRQSWIPTRCTPAKWKRSSA